MKTSEVAVLILAGGEGKRIGGAKPLRMFRGERLIDQALSHARRWSDAIAVAVRDCPQVGTVPAELIPDEDVPGPLGGLISGMKSAHQRGSPLMLAIPADMPFLPRDLLERLHQAIGEEECALAASGGHIHPICSLWRTSALAQAELYAGSGRRSLKGLAQLIGCVAVEWPVEPLDPFFNVNTSEDLAEAARRDGISVNHQIKRTKSLPAKQG